MRDKDLTLTDRVRRLESIFDTGSADFQKQFSNEIEMQQAVMSQRATLQQSGQRSQANTEINDRVPPPTAFEEIIERISFSTQRVHSIVLRIEEIGARVMGSLPESDEESSNGSMAPGPDGTLDHTFRVLDKLDRALSSLDCAALRLDRI